MKRMKPGTARDLDALHTHREQLIRKLATSTARLRRAQTIQDRYLSALQRTQATIDQLIDESKQIASRIAGKK